MVDPNTKNAKFASFAQLRVSENRVSVAKNIGMSTTLTLNQVGSAQFPHGSCLRYRPVMARKYLISPRCLYLISMYLSFGGRM